MDAELYTLHEVCDRLKVGRSSLYEIVKRGELKAVRVGRSMRFTPTDLSAYISQLREASQGKEACAA